MKAAFIHMKPIIKATYLKYLLMLVALLALASNCVALDRQPNADYRSRRIALSQKLNGGVAVLFAGTEAEGPSATQGFRQDNNFYYLTGWTEPGAAIVIAAQVTGHDTTPGRQDSEILFLPVHNSTQEKWTGPKLGADNPQAPAMTGFEQVRSLDQMPAELARILTGGSPAVYAELTQGGEVSASAYALDWLRRTNTFPMRTSIYDIRPLMAQLRVVKDQGEIDRIRHATDASMAAHMAALQMIKPGINEHDLDARMQY